MTTLAFIMFDGAGGALGGWAAGRLYQVLNLLLGQINMKILEEYVYSSFVLTSSTAGLGRVNDIQSIWHGSYIDFYRTQVNLGSNLWVPKSLPTRPCADLTDVTLAYEDTFMAMRQCT